MWISFKDPEFEALATLAVITLGIGTVFYHGVEGWSWLDSLFFSVTALTTVGYGNLVPHTDMGKLFTIAYLFIGIGVLLGFINFVAQNAIDEHKGSNIFPWRKKSSSS